MGAGRWALGAAASLLVAAWVGGLRPCLQEVRRPAPCGRGQPEKGNFGGRTSRSRDRGAAPCGKKGRRRPSVSPSMRERLAAGKGMPGGGPAVPVFVLFVTILRGTADSGMSGA